MDFALLFGKRACVLTFFVVFGICLVLLWCQRSIIYYPRGYQTGRVVASGVQEVRYGVAGVGEQVAFWLGEEVLPEWIWIGCGGNGAVALDWEGFAKRARLEGVGFVFFELPGYGLCEGKASPSAVRASMRGLREALAVRFGVKVEEVDRKVAFFGHSIGAASALIGAEEFGAKRVVLVSPFTTMTEMARRSVGVPLCYLNLHRYDNRARLRSLVERGGTAVLFHGIDDVLIPVEMSRELEAEFSQVVTLEEVPGAGHNDVIRIAERNIFAAMR